MNPHGVASRTDFEILEETDDYIVVNKPAPLQIHPSKPTPIPTLWDHLRDLLAYELANGGQLSIINRLDRETSGVVLVAKHRACARAFSFCMQRREFHKTYRALVWGWPSKDQFTIEAPLLRKGEIEPSPIWVKQRVHPNGQLSTTHVRVLEKFDRDTTNGSQFSLLEIKPITGRLHQIRVHLQHAGHSIVGDKIYGPDEQCYLSFIEHGWTSELESLLLLPRHALHAAELAVSVDGTDHRWIAPMPDELGWFTLA